MYDLFKTEDLLHLKRMKEYELNETTNRLMMDLVEIDAALAKRDETDKN